MAMAISLSYMANFPTCSSNRDANDKVIQKLHSFTVSSGNGTESCMDVWTSQRWIWCNAWNDEEQSHMGCLENASSSGSLSYLVGATHGMMKNNLIWVVSRMQVQVDHYPIWREIMEIDTWVGASGKNGMRRDWELRSHATCQVFARATSTWVMMNQKTRCLSKMPDEVRAEISPWFTEKQAIKEDNPEKIEKLDDSARYVNSDLQPKRSDLDMNHHVNNVKYVRWMLEAIPDEFLENYRLCGIILEYRRECGSSDVVQSLCEPDEGWIIKDGVQNNKNINLVNGHGLLGCLNKSPCRFIHLLQAKGETKNEEIVRGKTLWKKQLHTQPFST